MPSTYPPPRLTPDVSPFTEADLRTYLDLNTIPFGRTPGFRNFYDSLDALEAGRFERLWAAARSLEGGDAKVAAAHAEYLARAMPDEEDGAAALVVRTFAEALLCRCDPMGARGGNLYLEARPPGAQLRAFELLRLRTPLIPFAYAAGNRALLDAIEQPSEVTLIDIGIGRGGQVRALLRNPSARRCIVSLHVIGVEPDSSAQTGSGALELAEQTVLTSAREVGIPASFQGVPLRAEDLTVDGLCSLRLRGIVLANSAFALHHLQTDARSEGTRSSVLRVLRAAGVERIVLVEPDTNHDANDFLVRLLFAYRHYRTVERSLCSLLSPADAFLVWNEFFAPEVFNVVAHEGAARTERHEESARWCTRLQEASWAPERLVGLVPQAAAPPGFAVKSEGPAFSLTHGGVSVLSVLRARAAD